MIVVGVDGSSVSLEALRWAVEEGRLRGTAVRALLAWRYAHPIESSDPYLLSLGFDPEPADPGRALRLTEARLASAVAAALGDSDSVEQEVIEGHAASVLVEASRRAELLVVGSRGHGGFSGLLLGSVSHACANHALCPVVIVRPTAS
jgi:nucleotide-binding universal stress UspA family protein